MRRRGLAVALCAVGLLVLACEPFLLYEATLPEFQAPEGKALCVMIRPSQQGMKALNMVMGTGFDANALAKVYVDGKLVGGLTQNCVTSFEVDPGEHLVMSYVKTMSKIRYNFQAGKVYYISQGLMPIPFVGTGQVCKPMTPEDYRSKLADNQGALQYTKLNPNVPVENLDDDDVQDELKDWKKWAEKEPEEAKVEIEYPGY
jgi:glutaredoxin-related protein